MPQADILLLRLLCGRALQLRVLDRRALQINDPVTRLRFLQQANRLLDRRVPARRRVRFAHAVALIAAACVLVAAGWSHGTSAAPPAVRQERQQPLPAKASHAAPGVWPVETSPGYELYSNGLRIERSFTTDSRPRSGSILRRSPTGRFEAFYRGEPAGLVFHSAEGELAAFEPSSNESIKRQGQDLLEYVRTRRSYHFVIDRFGRVFRILDDGARANHAGHSVWAEQDLIYVDLNETFLGISFEARTGGGPAATPLSDAQVHAGRTLVEMLRARYGIAAANCVTHAQVSVNPSNFRIGYHTDWAGGFAFERFGLENNYQAPLPSVYLFGFQADPAYIRLADPELQHSLRESERLLSAGAGRPAVTPARRRVELRNEYQLARRTAGSSFPKQEKHASN